MFNLVPYQRRFPRQLFRDFFNDDFFGLTTVKADVYEDGDNLIIEADLPGFTKDEVKVQITDNQLTISAQRNEAKEEKTDNYFRRERSVNQACRTFIIEDMDAEKVQALHENGVLKLTLPKPEKLQPKTKEIDIQ